MRNCFLFLIIIISTYYILDSINTLQSLSPQLSGVDIITILLLEMKNRRLRKFRWLAWEQSASMWQTQDLNTLWCQSRFLLFLIATLQKVLAEHTHFFHGIMEKKKKPHEVRNTTSNFQIRKLTLHDFSMHTSRQVKIQNSSKAETGTQNAWVQNNLSLFLLCIWHCDSSWEKNWGLVQNLFLHKKGTVKLYRYLDTATGTIPLTAQILIHSIAN